jgi:hypothetical protein
VDSSDITAMAWRCAACAAMYNDVQRYPVCTAVNTAVQRVQRCTNDITACTACTADVRVLLMSGRCTAMYGDVRRVLNSVYSVYSVYFVQRNAA